MLIIKKSLIYIWKFAAIFVIITMSVVVIYSIVPPPLTPLMLIRSFDGAIGGNTAGIEKKWIPIKNISPNLLRAVIAAEDARFFQHEGVDWQAVESAQKYNKRQKGRKVRGASTITMQTAKNTFLWNSKTYIRKLFEAYFTILIEAFWGKERILEVYLNIIEWGNGIYGAEVAANIFFTKSAGKLSKREASLMAAVLPNPRRWSPARPTDYIRKRAARIRARMMAATLPKDLR